MRVCGYLWSIFLNKNHQRWMVIQLVWNCRSPEPSYEPHWRIKCWPASSASDLHVLTQASDFWAEPSLLVWIHDLAVYSCTFMLFCLWISQHQDPILFCAKKHSLCWCSRLSVLGTHPGWRYPTIADCYPPLPLVIIPHHRNITTSASHHSLLLLFEINHDSLLLLFLSLLYFITIIHSYP